MVISNHPNLTGLGVVGLVLLSSIFPVTWFLVPIIGPLLIAGGCVLYYANANRGPVRTVAVWLVFAGLVALVRIAVVLG